MIYGVGVTTYSISMRLFQRCAIAAAFATATATAAIKLMSKNYAWNVSVHNPFIYEWKFIIDLIFGAHTKKSSHTAWRMQQKKMHQTFVYRSRHNSNALRSHVPFTYIATELKLGRALIRPPSRWLAHTSAHAHYTTIDTYETFFFSTISNDTNTMRADFSFNAKPKWMCASV